jgi:hypothetical protein
MRPAGCLRRAALKLVEARLEDAELLVDSLELLPLEAGIASLHADVQERRAGESVETTDFGGILRSQRRVEQFVGDAQVGDEHCLAVEASEQETLRG